MKHHIVLFGDNGARIITTDDISHFVGMPNVAINPDLSAVSGIPTHHWKLVDSKILPVSEADRKEPNAKPIIEHTIVVSSPLMLRVALVSAAVSFAVSMAMRFI